jgi:hypothetical protein
MKSSGLSSKSGVLKNTLINVEKKDIRLKRDSGI